jgi:hypothetical protein
MSFHIKIEYRDGTEEKRIIESIFEIKEILREQWERPVDIILCTYDV